MYVCLQCLNGMSQTAPPSSGCCPSRSFFLSFLSSRTPSFFSGAPSSFACSMAYLLLPCVYLLHALQARAFFRRLPMFIKSYDAP